MCICVSSIIKRPSLRRSCDTMGDTQRNGSSCSPNSPTAKLYTKQEATIRTEFGETDTINIWKGVRQGCILSPLLFKIYTENIMREALEDMGWGNQYWR